MTPPALHPCSAWIAALRDRGEAALGAAYGDDRDLVERRRAAILAVLEHYAAAFGDEPVAVYRCPARLSLNPHADHQGAWVPYGTHAREMLCVCAPRSGGEFEVLNLDPAFASPLRFSLAEEINRAPAEWEAGWLEYIEAPPVAAARDALLAAEDGALHQGSLNYVKAAALRLHRERPDQPATGLRMLLHGDIPRGGGLSSSSALVVVTGAALNDFTGAGLARRALAELCGAAEWYVGTRGGAGDHAAMLLGHRAGLTHLQFRPPFEVRGVLYSPFPRGTQLALANCGRGAEKSASERLHFNRGIFAYRFAFLALSDALRRLAPSWGLRDALVDETDCLGDMNSERLPLPLLYRMLLALPDRMAPAALRERYPEPFAAAARGCFGTTDPADLPAEVPLRGAALYGLGRVDRGLAMPVLLSRPGEASAAEFGRLMSITHDGDRVTAWSGETATPYTLNQEQLADDHLSALCDAAQEGPGHPCWAEAQLRRQPGFYGASIPELDRLVDAALACPGVHGAGLMGAGGGGYVLILAAAGDNVFDQLRAALEERYYRPLDLEPDVERWHPVDAAGALPPPG